MVSEYPDRLLDRETLVLDVTYLCNASCNYCRWGNRNTDGAKHPAIESLLIPNVTLAILGIKRLVLSGGEPMLSPHLENILRYYRYRVESVILITNGYALTLQEVHRLLELGITGFTFSIDSLDKEEEFLTRQTPQVVFDHVIGTLERLSKPDRNYELGINTVVSHVNANWKSVKRILDFAYEHAIDFVKFQPVFDDGYAGTNSPQLLLTSEDIPDLSEVASQLGSSPFRSTNDISFWYDLLHILSGTVLYGRNCGLGSHMTNVIGGRMSMCFWLKDSIYGNASIKIPPDRFKKVQENFRSAIHNCKVDFHCFCSQKMNHRWR